jgi:potassium-transporting ATPase KdpC subunit
MDLKTNLKIAIRFTLITTVLLGVIYPMVITVLAHLTMRNKADGQLIMSDGTVIGSTIIGQSFTGDIYSMVVPLRRPMMQRTPADQPSHNRIGSSFERIEGDVATYQESNPSKPGKAPRRPPRLFSTAACSDV